MTKRVYARHHDGAMLTLVNTNRMNPPIAPVGLDYVAGALRQVGEIVELLDLNLADDPDVALSGYFARAQPELVGLSFRNVDDCFWPSATSFLPQLEKDIAAMRLYTDAPIALGGVGFSVFPRPLVERLDVEFGIHGDGEQAIVQLLTELRGLRHFDRVPGLVWREAGIVHANPPAWPGELAVPTSRDLVDNPTYFRRGGQIGLETKRGCFRRCAYCADPLAKGSAARLRDPAAVADEVEALLGQDIDVLHLCDAEFNLPVDHARDVCEAIIRRGLGERVRWYAYLAVIPFDGDLAGRMRRAGCVGINFTSDAASPVMLAAYGQPHRREDLARTVDACRGAGIAVMLDMLLGGPGETPDTLADTVRYFKGLDHDCAGAALGVRIYPGTGIHRRIAAERPMESNPAIRRRYQGPIDLARPTFYISPALGERPSRLVRELIDGDRRFFEPADEDGLAPQASGTDGDHNYNENEDLTRAIADGARGAYWDILRRLRGV